jgi:hypothetical protein
MSKEVIVCDTPLINPTISATVYELFFTFTKDSVVLSAKSEEIASMATIGSQVDIVLEDRYVVPMRLIKSDTHNMVKLKTTTQKCVNWLMKRYDVSFKGEDD